MREALGPTKQEGAKGENEKAAQKRPPVPVRGPRARLLSEERGKQQKEMCCVDPPRPPESNSRRWTPSHCDEACWYPQAKGRECEKGSLRAKPAKCFLEKQQALWNTLSPPPQQPIRHLGSSTGPAGHHSPASSTTTHLPPGAALPDPSPASSQPTPYLSRASWAPRLQLSKHVRSAQPPTFLHDPRKCLLSNSPNPPLPQGAGSLGSSCPQKKSGPWDTSGVSVGAKEAIMYFRFICVISIKG